MGARRQGPEERRSVDAKRGTARGQVGAKRLDKPGSGSAGTQTDQQTFEQSGRAAGAGPSQGQRYAIVLPGAKHRMDVIAGVGAQQGRPLTSRQAR